MLLIMMAVMKPVSFNAYAINYEKIGPDIMKADTSAYANKAVAVSADAPELLKVPLGISQTVKANRRDLNWAGTSTVSQFIDEKGRFCFAYCGDDTVTIIKTDYGRIVETIEVEKQYPLLGSVLCDQDGNIYLVWGRENTGNDTSMKTIFVSKYSSDGSLIRTAGGDGSEGLFHYDPSEDVPPSLESSYALKPYFDDTYNTKIPFRDGNCDAAVNGNVLLVNYAREMYNEHQSNGIFAVNIDDMSVNNNFYFFTTHSFDQRVTARRGTDGFLLESHGDGAPRAFRTALTGASKVTNEFDSFNFWVQEGAISDYDMVKLNATRARLGNILDTDKGAALVAASVRALSEDALTQPYDLFVQVFDPSLSSGDPQSYITSGERSGIGGWNGDKEVTEHGVKWLTDLAGSGKTIDVVQAVTTDSGDIVVLYELNADSYYSYDHDNEHDWYRKTYDSTWYMLLDAEGNIKQQPRSLGKVRLNADEDPVFSHGTVQWVSNPSGSDELELHILTLGTVSEEAVNLIIPTGNEIQLYLTNANEGTCVAAIYDADGKMLASGSQTIDANAGSITLSHSPVGASNACTMRIFLLDQSWAPMYDCISVDYSPIH